LVFFILAQTTFAQQRQPTSYDLVLTGGRVMDPESGLDAARDVGITGGRIAAISRQRLTGKQVLDVSGLVVAPGFVDLHAHGQDLKSSQFQARDGVTTALEMEVGTLSIPDWYAAREGKALINFGASAGHRQVRIRVKNGITVPDALFSPEAKQAEKLAEWKYKNATAPEVDELIALLDRGVAGGALGIGMIIQHTPGARREEILRVFQLAARRGVPSFAHVRQHSWNQVRMGSSRRRVSAAGSRRGKDVGYFRDGQVPARVLERFLGRQAYPRSGPADLAFAGAARSLGSPLNARRLDGPPGDCSRSP
jgi:cytosine/adenosine deaminase-related metal-dependent hydrolase